MFFSAKQAVIAIKTTERDVGGLHCHRRECGCGGCDRTWACEESSAWKAFFGESVGLAPLYLQAQPTHCCCCISERSVRVSAYTDGMDVMESRPHADVCSHDLSAAVGTVCIPRERPRVREVRTVERLEHQDRALLELNQIAHYPNVSRTLEFMQRGCWVRLDTRTHGEVIHSRRHKMFHSVFCSLKIQRHHDNCAVTSEMKNEKKDKGHSVRGHDKGSRQFHCGGSHMTMADIPRKF